MRSKLILVGIGAILVLIFYLSRLYTESITAFIKENTVWGVLLFLLITILDVVIVISPGLSISLVPVATEVFNILEAALLAILGWAIGALIAFQLARHYGRRLVEKFISKKKLGEARHLVPKKLFWTAFVIRLIFPIDIFSYAFGIFTKIDLRSYLLATILGTAPSAFGLAFIGSVPTYCGFAAIVAAGYYYRRKLGSKISLF